MAFNKIGDSAITKIMSVEDGKVKNVCHKCAKCGRENCICGLDTKHSNTGGKIENSR